MRCVISMLAVPQPLLRRWRRPGALLAVHRYRAGVSIPRGTTLAGRLASLGFADADRAERLISDGLALDIHGTDADLIEALAAAADPDAALAGLARLAPQAGVLGAPAGEPDFQRRPHA